LLNIEKIDIVLPDLPALGPHTVSVSKTTFFSPEQGMLSNIWNQFLHIIAQEAGSRVVETWFKAVSLHSWDQKTKTIVIQAPNTFVKSWVQTHYVGLLQYHLSRLLHTENPLIVFDVTSTAHSGTPVSPSIFHPAQSLSLDNEDPHRTAVSSKIRRHEPLDHKIQHYSFDTLVVGPNNSLAYAAARAIANQLGTLYNPFFVYGDSGLGKTHLLHAIASEIKKNNGEAKILYKSADRFVQDFVHAIRFGKDRDFEKKYGTVDILLIDDIQFIAHKEQTQEALFHIFNILYETKKQIVFSSDTLPQNIQGIADRLRSRLSGGLIADIYPPPLETKVAILKKKAALHQHELPNDVAYFIASRSVNNIRELEGYLVRLIAVASLTQQELSLSLAGQVLDDKSETPVKHVGFEQITRVVKKYYSYELSQLQSKERNKEIAFARHVAMYLMKKITRKSLRDIGSFLGGRNHTTVLHAMEKMEKYCENNIDFEHFVRQMEREIVGS
jgi:chromosomal replication initiator protein